MSYRVVYSKDGHEMLSDRLDTISEVNEKIRALYDAMTGVAILGIEEDHDGPRIWAIEYPPAPPAGTRVRDRHGKVRTITETSEIAMPGGTVYSWKGYLEYHGPLTEVVETEVEAAARRLRERGFDSSPLPASGDASLNDIETVLVHVLNGGTL